MDEVRKLAAKFDLPNKDRKDSQGICILGKVRHGPDFYDYSLTFDYGEDGQKDVVVVHLSEDDQGLAAGQFAAFYQGRKKCIGSGVLLESWDDQVFSYVKKLSRLQEWKINRSSGNQLR
ncbi:hypothetical protein ACOSQ2_017483 [Xanthoceras sorbifolium]